MILEKLPNLNETLEIVSVKPLLELVAP